MSRPTVPCKTCRETGVGPDGLRLCGDCHGKGVKPKWRNPIERLSKFRMGVRR